MATSREIEAEIAKLETDINNARKELDGTAERFIQETEQQMKDWIAREVKSLVATKPDQIAKLSDEQIKDMKRKVAEVSNNVREFASKIALSFQPYFPRHQADPTPARRDYLVEYVYRETVSSVGRVLNEFGLIDRDGNWRPRRDGSFRYSISVSHNVTPPALSIYATQLEKHDSLVDSLSQRRRDLERAKAVERFESL
jgi:hypothetical protein